jgi:hypothetical protein
MYSVAADDAVCFKPVPLPTASKYGGIWQENCNVYSVSFCK